MQTILTISNIIILIVIAILLYLVVKNKAIQNFFSAFNNKEEGYSGRKLTAFGFASLSAYVHYQGFKMSYINQSNIVTILLIDICVVLLALALIKVDDILKFKNGTTITETNSSTTTEKTEVK